MQIGQHVHIMSYSTGNAFGIGTLSNLRKLIISATFQISPVPRLTHASPLFKKERNTGGTTPVSNRYNPIFMHWSCTWPTLTANNHPRNAAQIDITQIL